MRRNINTCMQGKHAQSDNVMKNEFIHQQVQKNKKDKGTVYIQRFITL